MQMSLTEKRIPMRYTKLSVQSEELLKSYQYTGVKAYNWEVAQAQANECQANVSK